MFGFMDDADRLLRYLELSKYHNSPDLEAGFLISIRRDLRINLMVRIEGLEKSIKDEFYPLSSKEETESQLEGSRMMWDLFKFDLEGEKDVSYCTDLVNGRRGIVKEVDDGEKAG